MSESNDPKTIEAEVTEAKAAADSVFRPPVWLKARSAHWWDELAVALAILTRLPIGMSVERVTQLRYRALVWFPLVGVLIGAFGAVLDGVGSILGLPPTITAVLAVGGMAWLTRARFEDGLADFADGCSGGRYKSQKLQIMQDHRLGTHGAISLIVMLLLKVVAISSISTGEVVFAALISGSAWSYAVLPAIAAWLKPVEQDGFAAEARQQSGARLVISLLLGILISWIFLGADAGPTLAVGTIAALLVAIYSARQIGGYNSDALGAMQQAAEIAVLVTVVAVQV